MSGPELLVKSDDGSERLNIKVVNQEVSDAIFRIRRDTPLQKVINAYHQKVAEETDNATFVFLYDGRKIKGDQTPDELEMDDGAEIDAMLPKIGGADFLS